MRPILKGKQGFALIIVYTLLVLIVSMTGIFFFTSIQSARVSSQRQDFARSFYASESGIDRGLRTLPRRFNPMPVIPNGSLGVPVNSEYSVMVSPFPAGSFPPFDRWQVNAIGFVPGSAASPRAEVEIEVIAGFREDPGNFFHNALYSATDLTIKGNAYSIDGDVYYNEDGEYDVQHENVTGDITNGPTLNFITELDWGLLLHLATLQDAASPNTHVTTVDNFNNDAEAGQLSEDFWFDEALGIPNITYVQGADELTQAGNITLGGFIVFETRELIVAGTMNIDGCILVRGDLSNRGTVDITGGVWAGGAIDNDPNVGDGASLKGNVYLTYDEDYMTAVEGLNFLSVGLPNVFSWREIRREIQ